MTDMDNKNRIIFVTISMTGGGTERVIATLAGEYVSKGHSVDILMIGGNDVAYELDSRVNVVALSGSTGGSLAGRIGRISAMRRAFKADRNAIIIGMGTVAAMFSSIASLGLHNRLILSERNDPNRLNHRPIKAYEKIVRDMLYRRADKIVFQTPDARDCFRTGLKKKAQIIMNPLDPAWIETDVSGMRDKTIITAGRLSQQKNHKLLIDAFNIFHRDNPDYMLKIFGKGETEDELRAYIEKNELSDCVRLEGFTDNLKGELLRAQMYVSSSDWEGISNSLMEAMASGIGVIATDCPMGGSRMLIRDGVNGHLVATRDAEGLADAMVKMALDKDNREKMAKMARVICEEASVERIAKDWIS